MTAAQDHGLANVDGGLGVAGARPDHARIWLAPRGDWDDRVWCQDNVWADLPECADDPPTEYVRADLYADLLAALELILPFVGIAPAWAIETAKDAIRAAKGETP